MAFWACLRVQSYGDMKNLPRRNESLENNANFAAANRK
jgi:hypothetical protein